MFLSQFNQVRRQSKAKAHHMSDEEKKKRKKSARKVGFFGLHFFCNEN